MINIPSNSDFSIYNLPFGIFSVAGDAKRAGVAIGDQIIDLAALQASGALANLDLPTGIFEKDVLNDFIALGRPVWRALRSRLQALIQADDSKLLAALVPQSSATTHLPVRIGDYTDFYSSKEHSTNVGIMFRGKDNALMPNWLHMPIGYHGRSSSIIVSGQPIHRPKGQVVPKDSETPIFSETKLLDIELEMAYIIGKSTELGETISTAEAEDHVFGLLLFNDWSARDIQKWEYQPLGPFLGKNFASSVSPWIVTLDALEPFRVEAPVQDPPVMDYLQYEGKKAFDIQLEVYLKPKDGAEQKISASNHKYLYWTIVQQIAHHTINGCNLNVGDMMASGTISGPTKDSFGSLLELTWAGQEPIQLADGTERRFLQDYDTITIRGFCEKEGIRVGFGEVTTQILPAL
jgi:fumarylacetoacetase